jgi:predicted permease
MIGKEVIMPIVGFFLAIVFYDMGVINRVLTICVMIIYAAPTSLQLLMICAAHQHQVDNIAKLFMIMYLTAAIPMAAWTMWFLIYLY